jgi:hypothetical protein
MRQIVLEHGVQVFADEWQGYRAECECGWSSEWYDHDDEAGAEAAGIDHREVAVRPPDGTDGLIGELLDIADDIAQAVEWLGEHWPDGLPAPGWYGRGSQVGGDGDRVALLLWVYCRDDSELYRVANALGVLVTEDEHPNSLGHRYRRTRRLFGEHVAVEAYTAIGQPCSGCGTKFEGEVCPTCRQRADAGRDLAVVASGRPS